MYGTKVGFEVVRCIFRWSSPSSAWEMQSRPWDFRLPNAPYRAGSPLVHTCLLSVITESYWITHFATHFCPTIIQSRSRSLSRSASPPPTPTPAQTALHPSETPDPTATSTASQSPTPTTSASPTPTISQSSFCDLFRAATSQLVSFSVFCVEVHTSMFVETAATYGGGIRQR